MLRVDARGSKEQQLGHRSRSERGVDDIGLDLEVDGDEIRGKVGVGVDAADLGGGEEDVAGAVEEEEGLDVGLAGEVELRVGGDEEVGEA